ncbi:OFA family MFS transporter [Gelatiniphilus marinus]|uniref:OFA family MFS transporter n=1 Tax=Gelatiniphilus marinus TaxID=1759464 RepID=A0ABW5JVA5_9FLAO
MDALEAKRKGRKVLLAGFLSNLSVGILYTWSNLKDAIEYTLDPATGERLYSAWDVSQLNMPYSIGGAVFAIFLIFAGRLQDKIGPKKVMILGISMVGLSTIVSGLIVHIPILFYITFGVVLGAGLAFVYDCPRPAAMKWFHPSKKGLINGLVVAGFGLGALWLGFVEVYLLESLGLSLETTLMILGGLILVIGIPCAMNVIDPPKGYVPPTPEGYDPSKSKVAAKSPSVSLATTARTPQAWMLLVIYAFMCSAGALVISNATDLMRVVPDGGETGIYAATILGILGLMVPLTSVTNSIGRASGGIISDKIGRKQTYWLMHAIAALNMLGFAYVYNTPTLVVIGITLACVTYGSTLSVTPTIVADYFGLKNYGANYGLVYYGWGLSLIIGPTIAQYVKNEGLKAGLEGADLYKNAFLIAVALIVVSAIIVTMLKQPKFKPEQIVD